MSECIVSKLWRGRVLAWVPLVATQGRSGHGRAAALAQDYRRCCIASGSWTAAVPFDPNHSQLSFR